MFFKTKTVQDRQRMDRLHQKMLANFNARFQRVWKGEILLLQSWVLEGWHFWNGDWAPRHILSPKKHWWNWQNYKNNSRALEIRWTDLFENYFVKTTELRKYNGLCVVLIEVCLLSSSFVTWQTTREGLGKQESIPKLFKWNLGNKTIIGSSENIQHIPGDLKRSVYMEGCTYAQERAEKFPFIYSSIDDCEVLCKWKVKISVELETAWILKSDVIVTHQQRLDVLLVQGV